MIRRPPRSTQSRSSAASDVYKRQDLGCRETQDNRPETGRRLQMRTVKKRILHVDLSTNEVTTSDFTAKGLLGLGGKALGVALLERHLDPRIDPLAPGNPVIFTSSPLAAYGFSGSNRLGAFTKSPLT